MDLSAAMQSSALDLEPRPDLADVVRGRARGVRRRRAAAGSLLGVAAVAGAVLLVPDRPTPSTLVGQGTDHGIRGATSEVVVLDQLNGADVVGYYVDDQPCVAAIRIKNQQHCGPGVSAASTSAFPLVFPPDDGALRVDARQLVAGVAGSSVTTVRLVLDRGRPLVAATSPGRGFALPFFSVEVPAGAVPTAVEGLDAVGAVVGRQVLSR